MKGCKHRNVPYESALEQIEQMIEQMEPGSVVRIGDITERLNPESRNSDITMATETLLKKYGIGFTKG